ncbi:PREDICTED: programmed cell death protein 1 [Chaetura pelagica]|uniref:programmed cell death protein 1 n=1 Tax=Chaetura pelagica TaxID=8897 RepID=UPI000523B284|nr:PREDICTED: programmed cell death protein 1 [Chaetura pelagica]
MVVFLTSLCVLLLCCGPILAGCRRGGSATFFCNVSMKKNSSSEYSINWYKEVNHSQPQKVAEISMKNPQMKTEKYLLTNHTPSFKIEILNLHQNDSGIYYCGLINFFESNKLMESSRSHLVVTEALEKTNTTDEPEIEEGNPPDKVKAMLLGILLLAGAVVLLIFGCRTITYRRGDVQKPPSENVPVKEEKPPMVSVSTVDYGVLEFQWDSCSHVPPEARPVDQTEYATIVFPEEKPITPERRKKHQEERTQQLQPC